MKKVKAKRPAAKPKAAPKAAPKTKAPAAAKKKKPLAAAAPTSAPPKSGFMWKLLERKQAEVKQREDARHQRGHHDERAHAPADYGLQRFNGPRRKAA